jgi:GT2 family glycosyltransferase
MRKPGIKLTDRPLADVLEAGRQALSEHLHRLDIDAVVLHGELPATYRVRYLHQEKPMISIIVATRNEQRLLDRCIQAIFARANWKDFEVLVVDNNSDEFDALEYLDGLRSLGDELGGRIRLLNYDGQFNRLAMNNFASREAKGEYLLFIGRNVVALNDDWLTAMMEHAQRPRVGVVGPKFLDVGGNIQGGGLVLGLEGVAESSFKGRAADDPGYYARLKVDQNCSAVSGDCLLVRQSLFDEVGGFDERCFARYHGDVDLCLKIAEKGYLVVWTPYSICLYDEVEATKSTGFTQIDEANSDELSVYRHWLPRLASDPAYNRYLSLRTPAFEVDSDLALRWDPEWRPAPRIIAQPADRMGCGEYRIIAPARALINAGRVQGHEIDRIYTPPELARIKPDTLVLQRQVEPHQIEAIERHKRFNDVFCVFEIDDLVTNVPVKNAHKKHLPKDLYKRLRRAVGVCDRLVVATEPLAEAYSGLNADIKVVPNFIEEARWGGLSSTRGVGSKPRVGWAGGISHTGDLDLIAGVVEALKDEVEWIFFGMCPERVRPYVHEFHEPVSIDQYASHLAELNLDLALAPLEDVPFNHAKSHLRLLEYGILGYPVVCSDITPYRGDFPVTRVRNRYRDWVEAIREHVADLDALAAQGDALRSHVREHWLLENNLDAWMRGWLPET